VASKTLDISAANVATIAADINVAVYDLSVTVKNAAGTRLLADATVDISGPVTKSVTADAGVVSLTRLPTGTYTMDVKWMSPITGNSLVDIGSFTKDISVFKAEPDLLCKVYDIAIRVSDTKGRPVSEVKIVISNAEATTDATGTAVFSLVPEGSYSLKVEKAGANLGASPSSIGVSASEVDFAVTVGKIYDLGARVIGEQGQGLPYSTIYVKDPTGATATYTTDANGVITIPSLMEGNYDLTAEYKGFRSETRSVSVNTQGLVEEFKLPPYAEVFGVILTYWTFLAIVIGIILLIVVLAVLIHEYVTWRRRRLGIYLPAPPAKK
ncbi:MAG: carboxypeptidase-like regulatory domain-containing protein, partial [Nitrososphaeria archaeon]